MNKQTCRISTHVFEWTTYHYTTNQKCRHLIPIKRLVALRSVFTGKLALEWWVPANAKKKSVVIEPNDLPIKKYKETK